MTSGFRVKKCKMVSVFTLLDVNTWEVGRTLDKLETTPLRVVVSYAYLVISFT